MRPVTGAAVGLDLAPGMVAGAAEEAERVGLRVTALVGDAQAPDLPAASFDAVTASLVLFFLPDPPLQFGPGGPCSVTMAVSRRGLNRGVLTETLPPEPGRHPRR